MTESAFEGRDECADTRIAAVESGIRDGLSFGQHTDRVCAGGLSGARRQSSFRFPRGSGARECGVRWRTGGRGHRRCRSSMLSPAPECARARARSSTGMGSTSGESAASVSAALISSSRSPIRRASCGTRESKPIRSTVRRISSRSSGATATHLHRAPHPDPVCTSRGDKDRARRGNHPRGSACRYRHCA